MWYHAAPRTGGPPVWPWTPFRPLRSPALPRVLQPSEPCLPGPCESCLRQRNREICKECPRRQSPGRVHNVPKGKVIAVCTYVLTYELHGISIEKPRLVQATAFQQMARLCLLCFIQCLDGELVRTAGEGFSSGVYNLER